MSVQYSAAWFTGKRVTVMGLGLHGGGLATATWLLRHGACVTVTDQKPRAALAVGVRVLERVARRSTGSLRFVLGRHRTEDFRGADLIVQNPGVPRESPFLAMARRARVPIVNDVAIAFPILRALSKPPRITAVTGTRGKSTTTALIHAMLVAAGRRAFLAGNIRIPILSVLDRIIAASRKELVDVVLELSSWQCEHLSRATGGPDVAVVTNVMVDHLNRYRSMRAYAAAKARLVRFAPVVILNPRNSWTKRMGDHALRRVVWFPRTVRMPLVIPGAHNRENAAAAAAAARALDVPATAVRRALRSFRGLPGRLEIVARRGGVTYVNDTCATTPDATIAALQALRAAAGQQGSRAAGRGGIVLIAGGTDKHLRYDAWASEVPRAVKAVVFLPGTATDTMRATLRSSMIHDSSFMIHHAPSMRRAVQLAQRAAHRGDTVLLSPGAASFGLFRHEFDRGDQFVRAVRRLLMRASNI